MNDSVIANVGKITIPTYKEPNAEEMPMFAENRVHQRTSGNPYPNHIVLKVDRGEKIDKEYTCICLENKHLKIEILPELGGRVYSAFDKTTGYDFFYKQHVIKPALIGCLGSWVSGGLEFNWPFHHRASTFMPTDYYIEREEDGSAIVWLSEHDPIERMKGMVGICLKPNEAIFETRIKLTNRTPVTNSFLWWENTAVPVNKSYQIFFPKDVSYVNFHYKRSVTTYPIASNATGVFNGIRYNGDTDISMHKNTIQPTSYFSADSKYDFFGGFDHSKNCGVVHVANHHTAPGKKMFTWAYNQLSKSWKNALTDTDGEYAELMAGSYSDNQPDFSWIEPYETKNFSQYWYPIGAVGIPVFANLNGAIHWDNEKMVIQTTKDFQDARVIISDGEKVAFEENMELNAGATKEISCGLKNIGYNVMVICSNSVIMEYTEEQIDKFNVPNETEDMPNHKTVKTAQELYLEGVHVWQYRDPAILPDVYWKEALLRDGEHIDSLLALGNFYYKRAFYDEALSYTQKAFNVITKYNKRPQSGRVFFQLGLIYDKMGETDKAYDCFYKASWNMDYYSSAMTHISAIDGRRCDFTNMAEHSKNALLYNAENPIASVYNAIAQMKLGNNELCITKIEEILNNDPLNHLARYIYTLCGKMHESDFYGELYSDPSQTCLDLAFNLIDCGLNNEAKKLLEGLKNPSPMVCYTLNEYDKASSVELKSSFPFRLEEYAVLKKVIAENPNGLKANYYLGCLLYSKGHFEEGATHFEKEIELNPTFYIPYRNLAVANYSHLNRKDNVLPLLEKALELNPNDEQLIFETVFVMGKFGVKPQQRIDFVQKNSVGTMRDDICIELARAYNQNNEPEKALELFNVHTFVPCEGGEHAVAEQYMFAYHLIGRKLFKNKKYEEALKTFKNAQVLPQNLGAGLWNEVKLVPHQYFEAQCLDALDKKDEAEAIYKHILCLTIDYFSDMHLSELPYYQALCYSRMGDSLKGRAIINRYLKEWTIAEKAEDAGYFATTPFFISYCDDAKQSRTACYKYLTGLAKRYMGDVENSLKDLLISAKLEPINLYYKLESEI